MRAVSSVLPESNLSSLSTRTARIRGTCTSTSVRRFCNVFPTTVSPLSGVSWREKSRRKPSPGPRVYGPPYILVMMFSSANDPPSSELPMSRPIDQSFYRTHLLARFNYPGSLHPGTHGSSRVAFGNREDASIRRDGISANYPHDTFRSIPSTRASNQMHILRGYLVTPKGTTVTTSRDSYAILPSS